MFDAPEFMFHFASGLCFKEHL